MDLLDLSRLVAAVGNADLAAVESTRSVPLVELAEAWTKDSSVTGLRSSTLKSYAISLRLMARAGIRTPADATPGAVRAFLRSRVAGGCSPETANRNLAALSSLLGWLHAERRVPLAQVLELRELYLARPDKPHPDFLAPTRYLELRQAARARVKNPRFELLVAFGVEAGLRYHEAVQLWREDLEPTAEEPFVRVSLTHGRTNKKGRERTVPIRRTFAEELLALDLASGPLFRARERRGESLLSPYLHRGTLRRGASRPSRTSASGTGTSFGTRSPRGTSRREGGTSSPSSRAGWTRPSRCC